MKKSLIYFSALLALGFASCDDKSDLGVMQTNPQETLMVKDGVTVNLVAPATGDAIDLASYSGIIPVISYTADSTIPENAVMDFVMQLSKDDSFANAIDIPMEKVEGQDNTYGVQMEYWDDAFRHLLGKAPSAKDNYIRVATYVTINEQHSRIGGPDNWFAEKKLSVTPVDLHINVEEAYYLVGSFNGWDLSSAVKFSHSDQSQYDDPVFTLSLDIPANFETEGYWWKIVPQSSFEAQSWDGLYGTETDGDSALEGVLFVDGKAGCLNIAGQYLFTINMLDCTYTVSQAIPMLYVPGGGNDWSFDTNMLDTWDFTNYFGFVHMNGEFKVTDRPNWNGLKWGKGAEEGILKLNEEANANGPENGLYWMNMNVASAAYSFLKIDSIGIIGGFPGNDWASDFVELAPTDDILVWTGEVTFENDNIVWKFRTNGGWDANPNLGAGETPEVLVYNSSANLPAPGVGTYTVTLDMRTVPYSCSFVKK